MKKLARAGVPVWSSFVCAVIAVLMLAPVASAQQIPYWDNGNGAAITFDPVPWPSDAQWIGYTRNNDTINDQRTQDPSNGGTSPQAYVNVSSGCTDTALPSVFYFYDSVNKVIFYRWRVENAPNNYGTGPSPGSFSSTNPWSSGQWTVLFDTNGDGFRDFAVHLNGSSGSPSTPIDVLTGVWSPTLSNSIDYEEDPANIHRLLSNPTAFIQGASGSSNNQILQFDGLAMPKTIQWPNGSSETRWDYGTTRATDVSTSSCREYWIDYQIPLGLLDATSVGGPMITETTPFSFVFATANSLNNPFQKDVVLQGSYVCPPTAPAPFGDPLTLLGGIIQHPIITEVSVGGGSCTSVPLRAQILDSLEVVNCASVTTLDSAKFLYYFDVDGDGEDDDGGVWTDIADTTDRVGTTIVANWNTNNLVRGQYLIAVEAEDQDGRITRTWLDSAVVPIYVNFPTAGISPSTEGENFAKAIIGPPCGAPPPSMTKVASTNAAAAGDPLSYTLTITNNATAAITVSSISDTLPAGFTYVSNSAACATSVAPCTLGAPSSSPGGGAINTISWTFPPATIPASSSRTFTFNVTAGSAQGTFRNSATAVTNLGSVSAVDTTGVTVSNATLTISKFASVASDGTNTPVTKVQRGESVKFTITYANNSDESVTGAVITDVLPTGFLYTSSSPAATTNPGVGNNGTVTWNIGAIGANTGPFSVTVTATASVSGGFTNTATLTSTQAPTVSASTNIYVSGPLLSIAKTANLSATAVPATAVDYTIVYSNIGDVTAAITTVVDQVPAGFTLVAGAPTTAGCTQAGGIGTNVTCTINANLAAGASGTRVLRFTVSAAAPNPSVNTATVNASNAASASTTYSLAIISNTCNSSTYYFRRTTANVSTSSTYSVGYVDVTAGGAGYGAAPSVTFSAPPAGTTATGTAVIRSGAVVGVVVTNPGTGYTTAPTVTFGSGTAAATAVLTNNQRTANTTAPTNGAAATIGPEIVPATAIEVARFYSDVLSTTQAMALTTITGATTANPIVLLYIDKDGAPQVQARVTLYDFDPATQSMTQLAQGLSDTVNGNRTNEPHYVTTMPVNAGAILPANHRLLWTIEYISNNNDNNVTFNYDGTGSAAFGRVCVSPVVAAISKSVDKSVAVPGVDSLVYTINYSNPSATSIPGVVITDTIPSGLTFTTSTPAPTSNVGGVLTWNIGTLASGVAGTITVTMATTNGMPATFVTNTATLSNNVTPNLTASATTQLKKPNVAVTKRISDNTLVPGQAFTYTIEVVNNGNHPAAGVIVTDTLPSYITSTNFTGSTNTVAVVNITSGGSGYVTAPGVNFSGGGGTGAAGSSFIAGGQVVGVTITNGGTGYSSAPAVAFTAGTATATSQLAAVSLAGSTLTFNIGALNAGATAYLTISSVVGTSGIPTGDTLLTNTASVVDNYNTTPRNASVDATLTANPVITLSETATPSDRRVVYVDVTAGGTYTTIPTVSFTGGGCSGATGVVSVTGTPGNYSVTGVTITNPGTGCTSSPGVVFTGGGPGGATASATIGPAPGDTITYQLTVNNTGNADATGVVVFDDIPNYTTWLSGGTFSLGTVTFNVGTLPPSTPTILTYTVTVGETLPKGVTPLVTNGGATSTNAASPADVTTTVNTGAAPGYSITKDPDDLLKPFPVATLTANAVAATTITVANTRLVETGTYVAIGGTITYVVSRTNTTIDVFPAVTALAGTNVLQAVEYTLVYENYGSAPGTGVTVTDVLPANLAYAGIPPGYPAPSSAPLIGASGTITWTIGALTNGASGLLKFLAYATVSGVYTNTATISDGSALNTYNDSDDATTTFGALDPIKITSTPSVINQSPTNLAHWTITVSNPLAAAATNVAVIDNLPVGFTYKAGTTVINGSPAADPAGMYVAGLVLTNGGSGYTSVPAVTFSGGGGGAGFTAKAFLTGGVVTSVVITNPGYGFTSVPGIGFSGGGGAGAAATALLSTPSTSPQWSGLTIPGNGSITIAFDADISANVPAGLYQNEILVYGSTPSLTFDYLGTTVEDVQVCVPPPIVTAPPACGGSAGNVASILFQPASVVTWSITNGNGTITNPATGTVHQVALGDGGSGYSLPPAVWFSGGGGSGAAAIATVSGGVVTAVTVTNPGSGYTSLPTVNFTSNGSGSGADAVAVLGQGIVYTAGASGTVELLVNVVREFTTETAACSVNSTYSVSIVGPPTITTHPIDDTVCSGTLAQFNVTATDASAYQWQVSTNGGGAWSDIVGATAPTYAFIAVNGDNGNLYRVNVTRGPGCIVTSTAALLTVSCTPDLAVLTNIDTPDPVNAGENITYTQNLTNIGPITATNPTFTQNTPANTTFVSMTPPAGWTCGTTPAVGGTGAITCTANAGTIAAGVSSGDFTLVLKTDPGTAHGATITDTATVSMTEVDPTPLNNSKSTDTLVQRRVDVGVIKDNDATILPYGDDYLYTGDPTAPTPLTYTLTVENDGPSRATNVVVTDILPVEFTYDHTNDPAVCSQGSCLYNSGNRTLTCSLGALNPDVVATITISGTVDIAATQFTNTATVTRTEIDTNAANDSSSSTVFVLAPTEIRMLTIDAVHNKSGVTLTWQTGFEVDNLGFNVYRNVPGGAAVQLNKHLILGSALFTGRKLTDGRTYRFKDKDGTATSTYTIEDVDLRGVRTSHGPVAPHAGAEDAVEGPATDPDPGLGSVGGILESPRGLGVEFSGRTAPLEARTNQQWHLVSGQTAAKVIVTSAGWVRVAKRDLVAAGFDPGKDSKGLGVFADGIEVPIEVNDGGDNKFDDADTIEFFATGIDTPTAGGHVYYVSVNKGKAARVKKHNGAKSGIAAPKSFPYSYWRKERTVFFSGLVNNGDNDNFFGAIVTSWPVSEPVKVENLDTTGANAELEIVLQGAALKLEHVIHVTLNGRPAGTIRFMNQDRHVAKLSIPLSWLVNGDNMLQFTASDNWEDVSVVEAVRLTYPHLFRADNGALAFTVNALTEVNVAGFANDNVKAIDLTNANEPLRLDVKMSAATDGTRSAKIISPEGGIRTILVYADTRVAGPGQIVLNQPSTWNDNKNQADLVIVTNRAFLEAASTLKKARDAEGIVTSVIDVQNLYDEFSFGAHSPYAIRDFLKHAGAKWKRAPRYMILMGDASFDPRNYYGIGAVDYVPTKLIATAWMKTASDDWFADFDDDGIPSIAIGRISARTAAEAKTTVEKLVRRGTAPPSASWATALDLIVDRPDGVPFDVGANHLAGFVPSSVTLNRTNFATTPSPASAVRAAFDRGSLVMNYLGHGSVEIWSSNAMTSWTAPTLTNRDRLPFVVAMNCLNGYFHDLFTDSLAEALLRNGNGGAVAVWASSAMTSPDQQTMMNAELLRQIYGGSITIGDAVLKAKSGTKDKDVRRSFILFGDPTLKLR